MKIWLLLLVPAPALAGGFGVFGDAWVDEDRGESLGVEYAMGVEWQPVATLGGYENLWGEQSWYGGLGVRKSLWTYNQWDVSGGLSALYFSHDPSVETFDAPAGGGGTVGARMTITRQYERGDYVTPAASVRMSYSNFGMSLLAFEAPDEDVTTALQFSYTF